MTDSHLPNLARLERVALRDHFPREDRDFTQWLAQEENIQLLGETIDLDLTVVDVEAKIGNFRADILCTDDMDQRVLIENQLEPTNHGHLGQIMTYAAGTESHTVVWVARSFREEHRAALDWLNENTRSHLSFFGLEIQLWRIGESAVAPRFEIVARPNAWTKTASEAADASSSAARTETKQLQFEYWTQLLERAEATGTRVRPARARASTSVPIKIGRAGVWFSAHCSPRNNRVAVACAVGPKRSEVYEHLERDREAIEHELGVELSWKNEPGIGRRKITARKTADVTDRKLWPDLQDWTLEMLARFDEVLRPRINNARAREE